ncbi:MAG TPA: hypothetical protein VE423_06780, partial [Microvirga sp.]|nr:hypothetical protein [Microvirga sp.]
MVWYLIVVWTPPFSLIALAEDEAEVQRIEVRVLPRNPALGVEEAVADDQDTIGAGPELKLLLIRNRQF